MSYNVAANAGILQLPAFDTDTLLVNGGDASGSGGDTIWIGTQRDNLKPLGYPLAPLAAVNVTAGQVYYVLANSSTQILDFLPGASGFTPSPQQVVSILNTATLATQIGAAVPQAATIGAAVPQPTALANAANAAGARLVDNASSSFNYAFPGGVGDAFSILLGQGVSFSLYLSATGTSGANGTVIVKVSWANGTSSTSMLYEINASDIANSFVNNLTCITDRCRGDSVTIEWAASNGGPITGLSAQFVLSSRPADRPRLYDNAHSASGVFGNAIDLILGLASSSLTGVLPIAGTAPRYLFAATVGRIFLRASNAVSACTFTCAWGLGAVSPFVIKPVIGTDTLLELPATNRPLTVSVQNTGGVANAQFALEAWTQDD